MTTSRQVAVSDPSSVGEARRRAQEFATLLGFDEQDSAQVGLVVTETATNIVKHARAGTILLRALPRTTSAVAGDDARGRGLEILAIDKGPGIADSTTAGRDGYSTAGTLGLGLGSIERVAGHSEMYTRREGGVVLLAQSWPRGSAPVHEGRSFDVGAISVPVTGETECGDQWYVETHAHRVRVLVVDGLGHGPLAAAAAREAVATFRAYRDDKPGAAIERAHLALRPTRGAAAIAIELDGQARIARWCGAGNVAASIFSDGVRRQLVSHNGTLGHGTIRTQEFQAPWPEGSLLVAATDGVTTRWALDAYPGLEGRHPSIVAGILYRDFSRGRDDVTIVALRDRRS